MILGVTGLIGSGKSEVAGVFGRLGAKIIDCDRIGREVVENDQDILYRLVLEFGSGILDRRNRLDRRQLGHLAFETPGKTALLNSIVHPALMAELDRRMEHARENRYHAAVDAALLIYWKYHRKMDFTILVSAYTRNRIRRLRASGLTAEEIKQRTKAQLPLSYLRKHADFVLTNNDDRAQLRKKAKILYLKLTGREIG